MYLSWFSGMDPEGNPMPPGLPLVPHDVPEDLPAPADIPLEQPAAPGLFALGPIPLGVFDPVGEFMLLQQTYFNNQALNEVILDRMAQIHHEMGWDITMENFSPEDENQLEAEAPFDQAEEIPAAPPMDIFIDDNDD
jgi:hypothetical protein